ncbi:MAG TPA: LysR substrate-binding domain-containing protein [Steroidobacteraceae bacterium]|nr:LysR substrate-binding domain-containing protein [Steroidobacteraceae bacterium]
MGHSSGIRTFLRRRLNIRHIALMAQLDDSRSVVRAAEAAGMSQPAASTLLKGFEEALDVPLFERHARGIAPTPYGEILVRHARAILAEIEQVQEEIASLKSGLSGQAAVGAVATPATNLVPIAVGLLKQKHPGLLVSIDVDHSRPLVERLLGGQIDMAVARLLDSRGAGELQFEPLGEEFHAVIAGGGHPLAGATGIGLQDLLGQQWILPPPGSVLRDRLATVFLQQGLPMPANVVQTQSLAATLGLLRTGNAIVPLPRAVVQPLCDSGFFAVLIDDVGVAMSPFGIITRRKHKLSPGAQALLDAIRTTARTLYPAAPASADDGAEVFAVNA